MHPPDERPVFEKSNGRLVWPNGSVAHVFSAETPDSLRGPQFELAWCDEIAKWRDPETVWDMLQFGLRLGTSPRVCVTTTPRPLPFLKSLVADGATVTATRGKWLRAEPVAALYAEGRVVHVGHFPTPEGQMLAFGADGRVNGRSPDRPDALVWALTDLKLSPGARPGIRTL